MKQPFPQKQKSPFRPETLIGLILIAILLLSTLTLAYLYLKDRKQQDLLLKQVQETQKRLDQIHMSLTQGDLKKAFSELAQAQKNVADLLPPVTATAPKPVIAQKQPPAPIPVATVPCSRIQAACSGAGTGPSCSRNRPGKIGAGPQSGRIDPGCRRKPLSLYSGRSG